MRKYNKLTTALLILAATSCVAADTPTRFERGKSVVRRGVEGAQDRFSRAYTASKSEVSKRVYNVKQSREAQVALAASAFLVAMVLFQVRKISKLQERIKDPAFEGVQEYKQDQAHQTQLDQMRDNLEMGIRLENEGWRKALLQQYLCELEKRSQEINDLQSENQTLEDKQKRIKEGLVALQKKIGQQPPQPPKRTKIFGQAKPTDNKFGTIRRRAGQLIGIVGEESDSQASSSSSSDDGFGGKVIEV